METGRKRRCHLFQSVFTMFLCPPNQQWADRTTTWQSLSVRLIQTPFKKLRKFCLFARPSAFVRLSVCLMSGDVMATLVNAFSSLSLSLSRCPLCLLTTKVKYFPRRPSARPARVPVVWAPIMRGADGRSRVTSAATPPSFPAISEWTPAAGTRRVLSLAIDVLLRLF